MLRREFVDAFAEFRRLDDEADGVAVRAVVVSGNRRAFCVGADVDEFVDGTDLAHPEVVYETASRFAGPVVAEIDGYCLGGGLVLALSCGVCFAGERFRTLDVNYLIPTRRGATEEDVLEKMTARGEEVAVERARIDMVTGAHECRFLYVPSSSGEGTVVFVTNVDVRPETVVSFCQRYSRCWQIEAEYKSIKNDFLGKTSSKDYRVRLFYFVFAILLYNVWRITDFLLKAAVSSIEEFEYSPVLTAGECAEVVAAGLDPPG